MSYLIMGFVLQCFLLLTAFCLTALVIVVTLGQIRKVAHLSAIDLVEVYSRWQAARLDVKSRLLEINHKGKMLEVESDQAKMGIREQRLKLLAVLEEEALRQ